MNSLHKQRLLIIILAAVGAVAVFLPWVTENGSKVSGIASKGLQSWAALGALIGTIVICLQGEKGEPLDGLWKYLAIGLCALAAFFGIYKVLETIGFGLILLQVTSIGALMTAINAGKNNKADSRDLKELKD